MRAESKPIVVVKLGGSLLAWPDWPDHLRTLLASRPGIHPVLIVGGGQFADVLRNLDQIHALGESCSHALALQILDVTARLASALVANSRVVEEVDQIEHTWSVGLIPVLAPRRFLERDDSEAADPLPQTWATTTDSIAARLAQRLGADELVLLKSCHLPPPATDWPTAARLGIVDLEFPKAVAGLNQVSIVGFGREKSQSGNGPSSSGRSLG